MQGRRPPDQCRRREFALFCRWKEAARSNTAKGKEVRAVALLLVLALLLLVFGVVGGLAISKFLFFVLIVAAILALFGFFARTA
jgi:hypothetical protein